MPNAEGGRAGGSGRRPHRPTHGHGEMGEVFYSGAAGGAGKPAGGNA